MSITICRPPNAASLNALEDPAGHAANGVDDVDMGAGEDRLIVNYFNASFPADINTVLTLDGDGSYSGEYRGTASGGLRTGVTFSGVESLFNPVVVPGGCTFDVASVTFSYGEPCPAP